MALRALSLLPNRLQDHLIRRRMFNEHPLLDRLEIKVADSVEELELAAGVLYDAYIARGLIEAHPSGMRVTPHMAQASTTTLVAKDGDQVVGCLSLFLDGDRGLPMDEVFSAELDPLRAEGRKLGEIGATAIAPSYRQTGLAMIMFRMVFQVAYDLLGVDDLVYAVHPRAERYYCATMLCDRLGPTRCYPGLNAAALAALMRLDLHCFEDRLERAFGHRPKQNDNPAFLYHQREFSQLKMPASAGFAHELRYVREQAAARMLAAVRPRRFPRGSSVFPTEAPSVVT